MMMQGKFFYSCIGSFIIQTFAYRKLPSVTDVYFHSMLVREHTLHDFNPFGPILVHLLRYAFWSNMWTILKAVTGALEKHIYSLVVRGWGEVVIDLFH